MAQPQKICDLFQLDASTLSRNVERMRARDWLEVVRGADPCTQSFRLTPQGRGKLEQAFPVWEQAQHQAYGVLPGRFAWPAGLGDMAIGLTAPWIVLALVRRPSFVASRLFVIGNLPGILDLVAAVGNAALIQNQATVAVGEATAAPMAQLPLLLIPAYLVPLFIMLHVTALIQARCTAQAER